MLFVVFYYRLFFLLQLSRRVAEDSEVVGESTDAAEALAELRLRDSFDRVGFDDLIFW